ncbi:prepilin-type N-terminal cleavage/methylation domain-containing protein [Oxalobacteraceae bacterium A2-2]
MGAAAKRSAGNAGFTLVELVTVLVVISALAAIGVARFFDNTTFAARGYADQAKAVIRYAQKLAIAQNRNVFVRADGNSFAACFDAACSAANLARPPAGSNSGASATKTYCTVGSSYVAAWVCEGRPADVALSVTAGSTADAGPGGFFFFDAAGRPYGAADVNNAPGTASAFQRLVLRFASGSNNYTLTVEPETGYVH